MEFQVGFEVSTKTRFEATLTKKLTYKDIVKYFIASQILIAN